MAWQASGSAEGPVIGALQVGVGQDARLVILGEPAMQQGRQIEIGVLLGLPFPRSAEHLVPVGRLAWPLGLRGSCT